jgi:quercetin dioxygenase-like cupin family protein
MSCRIGHSDGVLPNMSECHAPKIIFSMPENSKSDDSIVRDHLLTAPVGARQITDVEILRIRFAPGQKGGLHLHPCPVTGYIVEGEALVQVDGEDPQILSAGQAFFEPAMKRILHFDNHSATAPMTFVAFYLLNGKQNLIEMLEEN